MCQNFGFFLKNEKIEVSVLDLGTNAIKRFGRYQVKIYFQMGRRSGDGPIKKFLRRFWATQFFKHSDWFKNLSSQSECLTFQCKLNGT